MGGSRGCLGIRLTEDGQDRQGTLVPLEAGGSALGEIWTFMGHFVRRNSGGWIQMSLHLIKVSAGMKHE